MYELTCPKCGHLETYPFVRIDAVTVCPKCRRTFQIAAEHVQRRVAGLAESGGAPLVSEQAVAQIERETSADLDPGDTGIRQLLHPPGPVALEEEDAWAVRLRRMVGWHAVSRWWWIGVAGLVVVGVCVAWWVGGQPQPQSAQNTAPPAATAAAAPVVSTPDPGPSDWLMLEAQELDPVRWTKIDEPFSPIEKKGPAILRRVQVGPPALGGRGFSARVLTNGPEVFVDSTLQLSLLSAEQPGRVIGESEITLPVLIADYEHPLQLMIPAPLSNQMAEVKWSVSLGKQLADAVLLKRVEAATDTSFSSRTVVRVTAYNPTDQSLRSAVFVITALDDQGRVMGQWRVDWQRAVGAWRKVLFAAITPIEGNPSVAHWHVVGVGRLQPSPTAPPSEPAAD